MADDVQRSTLPIPDLAYTGTVTYDATPGHALPADRAGCCRPRALRTCS